MQVRRYVTTGSALALAAALGVVVLEQPATALAPFSVPLTVPPQITDDDVTLRAAPADVEIIPGTRTRMWTYNGTFPGPTIRRPSGSTTTVTVQNDLGPTVGDLSLHHHGSHSRPPDDGHPHHYPVRPGEPRRYVFDHVEGGEPERAAFQWYHDHQMDQTARNVWMGLAGMFILEDPVEAALGLPSGEYDVPLMVTDRRFTADGRMPYTFDPRGVLGDTILVNGRPQPYMEVADRRYRFRILNASNTRQYEFMLSTEEQMAQVGTESGLLPRRVDRRRIRMGPGERVEIVLDFEGRMNQDLVLRNMLDNGALTDVMQFRVRRDVAGNSPRVPALLRPAPTHPEPVLTREWNFGQTNDADGSARWVINGRSYEPGRIDARPKLGTTERWILRNTSREDHLVHLHDVDWRLVRRGREGPQPHEDGLKETFRIAPNEEVELHTTFTDHLGVYIFHCHVLEHEDKAMMLQFEVVPASSA